MRARSLGLRPHRLAMFALVLFYFSGCGDAVPEDRTINVSPSGNRAAFQHGSDGIFVADPRSGEMHKVFDPDKSIIAVSTPFWSPDETRAIFTTARNEPVQEATSGRPKKSTGANGRAVASTPVVSAPAEWDDAPQGRYFFPAPVVYTCWQLERSADGTFKKPTPLFDAHCGHSGYIAGNWAIRRHPRNETILFVDRESPNGHAVWSFDSKSGRKSRVFPPAGVAAPDYVLGDYTPDGSSIVCTAGRNVGDVKSSASPRSATAEEADEKPSPSATSEIDGIWIQTTDTKWWHVAESTVKADQHVAAGLGTLIERRPIFTNDGARFLFVRQAGDSDKPQSLLFRGKTSERKVEQAFKSDGGIIDPHWSPDGSRMGFVAMGPHPALTVIDSQGKTEQVAPHEAVRSFAGWNSTGEQLGYVLSEHVPAANADLTSALLHPDPLGRDALVVVPKGGLPRVLLSGMRLTFPQWSPARESISAWGTFIPSHQSWVDDTLSHGLSLRQGDPAAVIDVPTGLIRWLAINGDEEAQIGHYLQLKRDFSGALDRYRKAEKTLPKLASLTPIELEQGVSGATSRRRMFEFFLSHCLTKLHENGEAAEHLKTFEQAYHVQWPHATASIGSAEANRTTPAPPNANAAALSSSESRPLAERLASIIRALAEAQALLSLNDLDGAIEFFTQKLAADPTHADSVERLGDLYALSQLYLLAKRPQQYLQVVTDELGPVIASTLEDRRNASSTAAADSLRLALADCSGRALFPLFSHEPLRSVPSEQVAQAAAKWRALRRQSKSQCATLIVDYVSRGLLPAGQDHDRAELDARIAQNPARSWFNWNVRPAP
jgi:tetratricopeptide (TPR) repeat protein